MNAMDAGKQWIKLPWLELRNDVENASGRVELPA
jgi:hypothetical protein